VKTDKLSTLWNRTTSGASRTEVFERKNYFPRKWLIRKTMVPSESAPQELSTEEWPRQYGSTILNTLYNLCVPPLVTEDTISH
jgi:hypothetical protein